MEGPKLKVTELVSMAEIEDARRRLEGVAVVTPLDRSRSLSEVVGGEVFIKCENLQRTGSFKVRGAYNRIGLLTDEEKRTGVIAASAGNHGQGVALAANLVGVEATVFMPEVAALPKVEATKRYGAKVVLTGEDFGEALAASLEHQETTGAVFVHPFDHPHVIAGQGTIGCEVVEQLEGVGSVVVPVGGGGLVSGVAVALRARKPSMRIVGVQAAGAAAFPPSLERGEPVVLETVRTIADGIAANAPGELTLAHVRDLVDEMVTVTDDSIAQAVLFAAERMKLVLEPAGAAGVAVVLEGLGGLVPPVAVLLSGGNIDPLLLLRAVRFGLSAAGRYCAFRTRLADRPGELHRLLGLVAEKGANIVGVEHHRAGVGVHLEEVDVALQVETRGAEHIRELTDHLTSHGYVIERL